MFDRRGMIGTMLGSLAAIPAAIVEVFTDFNSDPLQYLDGQKFQIRNECSNRTGLEELSYGVNAKELKKRMDDLRYLLEVSHRDGTFDYDPYFQGMANGLSVAVATMEDTLPIYKDAPDKWIGDHESFAHHIKAVRKEMKADPELYDGYFCNVKWAIIGDWPQGHTKDADLAAHAVMRTLFTGKMHDETL
tara:strand:- start:9730 stop:10299 length:570 start_codon:yes stop_codon:yes gene_type:complete